MSVTTGHGPPEGSREAARRRDRSRRDELALLRELREVEHWRRLVAARLDLAVAAVAGLDEPGVRTLPAPARPGPGLGAAPGLRELLGLTGAAQELSLLPRLRDAQRDLDAYAGALQAQARVTTAHLVSRLDGHRLGTAVGACPAPATDPTVLAPVLHLRRRGRRTPDDVA